MSEQQSVAFIGLGVMGYPMAGHLNNAGYSVTVYNRTTTKAVSWVQRYGGCYAETPAQAVRGASIVFSCVGNDDALRQVMLGEGGVSNGLSEGAVIVDHTTTSADVAKDMAQLFARQGHGFIDAPVSGGQAGAENGRLTVMCGGEADVYRQVEPIIQVYATCVKLLGPSGAGQLTKMVNQICIAGLVQGLAEGLHFARSAKLDIAAVVDVISKGAAQSWQMENRYQTMIDGDYEHGFAVDWMRKDLGYVLQEARNNDSHLPVTMLVDQFYSEVQALGGSRWDTSSLLARLEALRK
ncbi:MAG: NAD(P)-dependent oxidoreductase [Pseudomonadales bacterium]